MTVLKKTAEKWADLEEMTQQNPDTNRTRGTISGAIAYFDSIEEQCDKLIQEQDDLIRQVTRRLPGRSDDWPSEDTHQPLSGTMAPAAAKPTDLPFEEFRQVADLANKVVPRQMPMATNRFMRQASRDEIDRIEQLEVAIDCQRELMRSIEEQILNFTPQTAEEVVIKLKFVSTLMLDGGEIETDFFAYLVEESAEILGELLSVKYPA